LKEGGIIVFDNSNIKRHREAIESSELDFELYSGLTPASPYPTETAILHKRMIKWSFRLSSRSTTRRPPSVRSSNMSKPLTSALLRRRSSSRTTIRPTKVGRLSPESSGTAGLSRCTLL
jgi:hypothetical protein